MEDNKQDAINDAINNANKGINDTMNKFNGMIQSIMPQSTPKEITIEVVIEKGFLGFGRKVKTIKATAYISMNNLINLDIQDKTEMKKYFDSLK